MGNSTTSSHLVNTKKSAFWDYYLNKYLKLNDLE